VVRLGSNDVSEGHIWVGFLGKVEALTSGVVIHQIQGTKTHLDGVDRTDIHKLNLVGIVDDGINDDILLLKSFSKTSQDRGGGLKVPDALTSDP
jgi:hypothetical protein